MSFQLENEVPVPGARNRYPFGQMTKGQSFAIVGEENSRMVRNAAYQFSKKENGKRQAAIDAAAAAAVKEATEAGGTPEEIKAVTEEVTASATASAPAKVEFTLRLTETEVTDKQATGEDGKPLVDGEGNAVMETVKHYRLWRQ